MSTEVLKARSRLATLSRRAVGASPSQIDDARRQLAEAKILDYIEKTLAEAPPMTDEMLTKLSALFRAGGA
jgi:hypothetical protein